MPAVHPPAPGLDFGPGALEILGGLRGINLVGMDVVEVAPAYDNADITSLAAATLAMEMLCLYAARHKVDR
ncbi:Agmatinase [Pseudomonas fluorescens]|uniref:Agmatinase n=1 Tax=Pseudomonas fluorescens TaxID=294 RepID=A0A5E7BDM6_PSEFL|nr:Agmatinase [Pseudomonas fluorescens]